MPLVQCGSGVSPSPAARCVLDIERFPGATGWDRLKSAVAAAPAGGAIIDATCLRGAQSIPSTLTIDKPVQIIFGAGVLTAVAGANPAIFIEQGGGDGAMLVGAGSYGTIIKVAAGKTGIRWEGHDVVMSDIRVQYTAHNATNLGIDINAGTNPNVLRPKLERVQVEGPSGAPTAGSKGIKFTKCYVGANIDPYIHGFEAGVYYTDSGLGVSSNAVRTTRGRFWNNTYDVWMPDCGFNNDFFQTTLEGSYQYAARLGKGAAVFKSCYFEQLASDGALGNVLIDGITSAFSHTYTFDCCEFLSSGIGAGTDIILGAGTFQQVRVIGGQLNEGITIGAGQPVALVDAQNFGTNAGRVVSMLSTVSAYVETGNANVSRTVQGYSDFTVTCPVFATLVSTATGATSATPLTSSVIANPGANSACNFFGGRFSASTFTGNIRNITGSLIGSQSQVVHDGTGTVTIAESINVQMSNINSGAITTGIGILVAPPVVSGGSIGTYTGIYIQEPLAANTNRAFVVGSGKVILNEDGTTRGDFNVKSSLSSNFVWFYAEWDAVAIGQTVSNYSTKLTVYHESIAASGSFFGQVTSHEHDPAGNSASVIYGQFTTAGIKLNNSHTQNVVTGGQFTGQHRGTGALTSLVGVVGDLEILNTGNVTGAKCFATVYSQTAASTVTDGFGVIINAPSVSGGGTLTNWYGLYIVQPTAAGLNYAMFIAGGYCYMGGQIEAAAGLIVTGNPAYAPAGSVGLTKDSNEASNSSGVGTILFKGSTSRNSKGFAKILVDGADRWVPYFDAITG